MEICWTCTCNWLVNVVTHRGSYETDKSTDKQPKPAKHLISQTKWTFQHVSTASQNWFWNWSTATIEHLGLLCALGLLPTPSLLLYLTSSGKFCRMLMKSVSCTCLVRGFQVLFAVCCHGGRLISAVLGRALLASRSTAAFDEKCKPACKCF